MSTMQPGQSPQSDLTGTGEPVGQDEQVGGAQEHSVDSDPQVGEATSTESDSRVRESGAESQSALREQNDSDDRDRTDRDMSDDRDRRDVGDSRDGERDSDSDYDGDPRIEDDKDRRRREEDFAAEHDPSQHDVAAGDEFRQRGDVVADGDRAKAVDGEGRYIDAGEASGLSDGSATPAEGDSKA